MTEPTAVPATDHAAHSAVDATAGPTTTRATAGLAATPTAQPNPESNSESNPTVAATDSGHDPQPPFDPSEWIGDWISFEQLINSRDPVIERAWADAETAMRGRRSMFSLMLPFFGGSIRRFWRWACRTTGRENRHTPIAGWHIEPLEFGENAGNGFALEWRSDESTVIGRYAYQFDHMIDRGLEGKPCYVFHADSAPAGSPFRVLIAMDPMPERAALANGGLLSHLHFQYGSSEAALLRGPDKGAAAKLRHRMWYPTMCAAEGDLLARCNIIRVLHHLPAWEQLPEAA